MLSRSDPTRSRPARGRGLAWSLRAGRWNCVRQWNIEDCGAACLASVCRQHGLRRDLADVRALVGTTGTGTTLLGLQRGAERLGFHTRAAQAGPDLLDHLDEVPLPLILHWKGCHWVVLHGRRGGRWLVADPAHGLQWHDRDSLLRHWNDGVLLLLEPDPVRLEAARQQRPAAGGGWGWLATLVAPFRPLLWRAFALNGVIGLMALALPVLMQVLTDDVLVRGDGRLLAGFCLGIALLFLIRALLNLMQGVLVGHFGQKLRLQMVLHYGQRLLRLPLSHFESRRSGEAVSRLADIDQLRDLMSQVMLALPSQCCVALISLMVMALYSPPLTLAALAGQGLVLLAYAAVLPALQRRTRALTVQSAENQGFLVEVFRGSTLLRTTAAHQQAWQEFQRNFGRLAHLAWDALLLELRAGTLTTLLASLTTIGVLWYGSTFVLSGRMTIGQLLAFHGMSANVLVFLGALGGATENLLRSRIVISRLSDVLQEEPEDADGRHRHTVAIAPAEPIRCDGVSFHHPGRRRLLHDLTLELPGGQVTALVGPSGCGKSTLVRLLAGLYPLEAGSIRFGAFDGADIAIDSLRRQVVLLPQEAVFLSRSIFDNFVFAHPGVTFEEVVHLCRLTLADDFIHSLPNGYHTVLGEFGLNLSGGQRQRLALARALVGEPPVLLLDESTSALDPDMEQRVMERLLRHRLGRTTVLVSHRPSVIRRADWIVHLENGQVRHQNRPEALGDCLDLHPYLLTP
jgi:ABC-type bacteriocin/lantibiotic exporter with double-glycine peptidase domain